MVVSPAWILWIPLSYVLSLCALPSYPDSPSINQWILFIQMSATYYLYSSSLPITILPGYWVGGVSGSYSLQRRHFKNRESNCPEKPYIMSAVCVCALLWKSTIEKWCPQCVCSLQLLWMLMPIILENKLCTCVLHWLTSDLFVALLMLLFLLCIYKLLLLVYCLSVLYFVNICMVVF